MVLCLPAAAQARGRGPLWLEAGPDPDAAKQVIQRRHFPMGHELYLLCGALPADPLYRAGSLSGGYTLHLSDHWAWDLLQLSLFMSAATNLAAELQVLEVAQGLVPAEQPRLQAAVATHLVLKPLYGKLALGRLALATLEAYLLLGPGLYRLTQLSGSHALVPGGDWAAGMRLHLGPTLSLRAQVGQSFFYLQRQVWQALRLDLGFSWNFGADT